MITIRDCLFSILSISDDGSRVPKVTSIEIFDKKYNLPTFSSVWVIDKNNISYPGRFKASDLMEIEQYEECFENILNSGYAWVDVQFGGYLRDKLIMIVYYPCEATGVPAGKTKIELHGPALDINDAPRWDITKLYDVIE